MASIFHSQTLLLQCHNKIKWVGQIIISPSSCLPARETVALFSFKSLVKGKLKYYKWLIGVLSWAPWSLGLLKINFTSFHSFLSTLPSIFSLQFWLDPKVFCVIIGNVCQKLAKLWFTFRGCSSNMHSARLRETKNFLRADRKQFLGMKFHRN